MEITRASCADTLVHCALGAVLFVKASNVLDAVEVLSLLETNLETKSRQYKKPVLTTLFLLNNYHYLLKTTLSHARFASMLGSDVEQKYEKQIAKYKNQYQDRCVHGAPLGMQTEITDASS